LSESNLDELDYAILSHLQDEGRKAFKDIAEALGVSSSTITNRYTRLVTEGYVGIYAYVNHIKIGFKTPAFVGIKVKAGYLESVASALSDLPEADYVAIISGQYDIDVTLSCRDHEHLLTVIETIHKIKGVADTHTNLALRMVKFKQANVSLLQKT
jgi:Lrp/AsnC family transcriptional regulator for asnA, asnC and gidA